MGVAIGPIKLDLRGADLAAREITLKIYRTGDHQNASFGWHQA